MTARGDRVGPLSDADLLTKFSLSAARLDSERSARLSRGYMTLSAGFPAGHLVSNLFSPI